MTAGSDEPPQRRRLGFGGLTAVLLLATTVTVGAAAAAQPISYTIEARYDASAHTLQGRESIRWTNQGGASAEDFYLHLYWNAFANSRSSFVRATGTAWVDWIEEHPDAWGNITLTALRIGGEDLLPRLAFVHPDDDNVEDRTVARVPLPSVVPPGETITLEVEFAAKLPRIIARAGYAGPFAFVAQWFPKLGVFENGSWNCHQYHLTTEFYSDFGAYDVTLTVPEAGVVGATGELRETRSNRDGTQTLRFVSENVHDFAWTVDPRFRVFERSIEGVQVRLLLQPAHLSQVGRHFAALEAALRYYRNGIGTYPYRQLTVVDPGYGGAGAGGMEYPTLITAGTTSWMPLGLRFPELVTVHEFGHQYWYGMVANNEFEEAWLDEGVNSYVEGRIMDETYGPGSYIDLFGLKAGSTALRRAQYLRAASQDPLDHPAWDYLDRQSYSSVSYGKTALMLTTLAGQIGDAELRQALAQYFERWRFKHPRGGDFLQAIRDASGQDLRWYFDQVVPDTGVVDYAVTRANADQDRGFAGYRFAGGKAGEVVPLSESDEARYRSEIVVERLGTVRLPVDVRVVFDDGTHVDERWDGEERWKRFEYTGPQRVEWAIVDPERKIPLDVNLINNSRMREGGTRGLVRLTARWSFWFSNLVYFLSGL